VQHRKSKANNIC